jgi:hypothetical protein
MSNHSEAGGNRQLRLEFEATQSSKSEPVVINFIDAGTRALRKEALERLKRSGVFELPDVHRLR